MSCCRDDNISLDTIVSWLESGGYKLRRMADYAQWFAKFKAGLQKLPHQQQASSSLPIIYQWEKPMSGPAFKCAQAPSTSLCLQ
jgi:fatty acid CoA ligase FadD9